MKLYKYVLLFAAALGLTASMSSCDDDSATGAGDATIGFAQSTYTFKESAGLVKIQLTFTGEPKEYPIVFDVTATVTGGDRLMNELVHFTQLEGLRYMGNEAAPAFIEFEIYDDDVINDSRFFTLTIASASGAEIVGGTTTVEIADNDNNPYERLWGNWTLTDGSGASFDVNISGGFTDEDVEKNADKLLVCWGFGGYAEDLTSYGGAYVPLKQPVWYINYDAETERLSVAVNTLMANIWSFNGIDEDCNVTMMSYDENGSSSTQQVAITVSEDMNTMTFDTNYGLRAHVIGASSGENYGYWLQATPGIVMTRK